MAQCFKEFYFTFYFIYFQFVNNHQPTVFITTLKSKFNSQVLISLKSFVRRKPIPVFDPRPLCCSSLTTAVRGTKDTNIVDSESPYCGTNQLFPLHYSISSCFDILHSRLVELIKKPYEIDGNQPDFVMIGLTRRFGFQFLQKLQNNPEMRPEVQ